MSNLIVEMAYNRYRRLLFSIAYRLLGSAVDAEDAVQDAFISLHASEVALIRDVKAYLCRTVTNRCLNVMKGAKRRTESYPGPWLPEPLYDSPPHNGQSPHMQIEQNEAIHYAYLVMLERLGPYERAAFVLREAFTFKYEEISQMLGKTPDNCRQLFSRARRKLRESSYGHRPPDEQQTQIVQQFVHALNQGHVLAAVQLLAEDAVLITDGGGKVRSAMRPIYGKTRVAAFIRGVSAKRVFAHGVHFARVNGESAMAVTRAGLPDAVWCFELEPASHKIGRIYAVQNPDKCAR